MAVTNGTENDDVLVGTSGSDDICGFDGDDTLDGGLGNNTLTGGAGSDTFVVNMRGNHTTTITDFVVGEDRLDLSGYGRGEF